MPRDNASSILTKFVNLLRIPVDEQVVLDELLIHPDYPSLLSLSDVLKTFKVENVGFSSTLDGLSNIPCPFIIQTAVNQGDFLIITDMENKHLMAWNEVQGKHMITLDHLKSIATGVILAAEYEDRRSWNTTVSLQLRKLSRSFNVGILFFLLLLGGLHSGYFQGATLMIGWLTILKCAGLATSVLLLIQSIDSNNPMVKKICKGGEDNNCSAILSSDAAKIFDWLSWSEVGFFYFSSTLLLTFFGNGLQSAIVVVALINVVSLPFTIYSIYYQAAVAKQWCILCCTVQALIWLEFISLVLFGYPSLVLTTRPPLTMLLSCFLAPVSLWYILKPLLQKGQQVLPLKQELQKFKYNTDFFKNTLAGGTKYPEIDEEFCIVLGNTDAENVITMVSNPYCQPCAKAHKLLAELLKHRANVKAQIIFTVSLDANDSRTIVSRHLMALNALDDRSVIEQGLHDWYRQVNYNSWAENYPVKIEQHVSEVMQRQYEWCKAAMVAATPTILLNGYELSSSYKLTDLKYMLN